ncbi:efflux RND transporter periplasmic adaptor subunit [Hyphomicrobium sp. LHD-15]|uniref:efflux RND transporter periplasmic adaptor subunit n=1 Tax=Hyphomicrobium sp. LHD-15 TaxID=3072142 RepID=UPI00280FF6A5|nr:efflux RND transporter periplasmic adaptor subunit [Hyphomicrobium sp. LHD-15]MDQ8697793.1 efflux RND transporter periplasmic adaptor subunit [Hyphomicrobium sp. LHD-15]
MVYDTLPAAKGQIRKIVSTAGPVRALVTVSVGSQLSGQVDEVRVDFNSEVKPGDILATLDSKTFSAKVAQAKADLVAAEAALANQEAATNKSEAVLQAAETNVARQQALAEKRLSPQLTYETALRDRDVAKADIAVMEAQVASARATIQQRQASLDQATIDLERAEIRSPIDGTVISRTVDPGQTVAASLQAPELFKIAQDLSRIRIEAQVNEADVGAVGEGNTATFTVDAYPDRQFEGRVTQVRLAATEISSVVTYTVIIEADNPGRKLFPGMTANVVILSATRDGVLRISNDALRFKPKIAAAETQARGGDRGAGGAGGAGDRTGRMVERLKTEVELTDEQQAAVKQVLEKLGQEARESSQGSLMGGPSDPSAFRQKATARIEQALGPTLTEGQRTKFQRWKDGRETTRFATVWVLGASETPERRSIRTGIADDQFTEVLGGDLKEGERVIVRGRDLKS